MGLLSRGGFPGLLDALLGTHSEDLQGSSWALPLLGLGASAAGVPGPMPGFMAGKPRVQAGLASPVRLDDTVLPLREGLCDDKGAL